MFQKSHIKSDLVLLFLPLIAFIQLAQPANAEQKSERKRKMWCSREEVTTALLQVAFDNNPPARPMYLFNIREEKQGDFSSEASPENARADCLNQNPDLYAKAYIARNDPYFQKFFSHAFLLQTFLSAQKFHRENPLMPAIIPQGYLCDRTQEIHNHLSDPKQIDNGIAYCLNKITQEIKTIDNQFGPLEKYLSSANRAEEIIANLPEEYRNDTLLELPKLLKGER